MSENEKIDTTNIFEDFEGDKSLKEDINNMEKEVDKDYIYYISLLGSIFKYINFAIFIVIAVLGSYIFVENNTGAKFYEKAFLEPFCNILIGDNKDKMEESYCSGVGVLIKKYDSKLEKQKEIVMYNLVPVLKETYQVNDFLKSKKVSFVLNKTETKTNPLKILARFDYIKNQFLSIDKSQIACYDIKIKDSTLESNCFAFSSYWDGDIPGFNLEKGNQKTLGGTSISIASSFLNYLDKYRDTETKQKVFDLKDKQKVFNSQRLTGDDGYIYKTNFKLKLFYKNIN